uniref:Uncharacterized protein n=1 Tax=Oryza punctata TaxID=4537 RepID=A0A0E0LGX5_ORYPU
MGLIGLHLIRLGGHPHSGGNAGERANHSTAPPPIRFAGRRPPTASLGSTHWLRHGVLTRGRSLPAHQIDSPAGVA